MTGMTADFWITEDSIDIQENYFYSFKIKREFLSNKAMKKKVKFGK